jgi:autotransporter adhesin
MIIRKKSIAVIAVASAFPCIAAATQNCDGDSGILGGTGSVVCGDSNIVSSAYSAALGLSNTAGGGGATNGVVSIGVYNSAYGTSVAAIGYNNTIGSPLNPYSGNWLAVVGSGNVITDSHSYSSSFGVVNYVDGDESSAFGYYNQVTADYALAAGAFNVVSGQHSVALGSYSAATGDYSIAIGSNAQATANNSVAIGQNSVANESNTVSIGSAGNERRLVNVAPGIAPTDAVNVSQLRNVERTANAGIAVSLAMSQPVMMSPDATRAVTAGFGSFRGQNALAFAAHVRPRENVLISAGAGVAEGGDHGLRAGISVSW